MALSDRQLLASLSRTPLVDAAELARILGEAHATVHHWLSELLAGGIMGRVSHGTAHPTVEWEILPVGEGHQASRRH